MLSAGLVMLLMKSGEGLYSASNGSAHSVGDELVYLLRGHVLCRFLWALLFYVRTLAVPWLGGEGEKGVSNMLWQGFECASGH